MYDQHDIVLAFDGTGSLTNRYLHCPLVDQVLADENLFEDEVFWALADNLGTVRTLLDNAGNRVRDRVFAAWGAIVEDTLPGVVFPFAFTGREYDPETGLYDYRARYYDPATGGFLSEDPLGFAAGDTNLSRYVLNSPTNFTDPTGQFIHIALGVLVIGGGIVAGAWMWGDELGPLLSGESARASGLDRQRRQQQLGAYMKQDDFAGAAAFDVGWRKAAAQSASGEMKMMAAMYYEWAGGVFAFVTPMGSLDDLPRVGRMYQHHADDIADLFPSMGPRLAGGAGVAPNGVEDLVRKVGDDATKWLGKGAKVITNEFGDTIVESADGLRQIRFDFNHPYPHKNPHIHLIEYKWLKNKKVEVSNRRIYPLGATPE